MVTYLKIITQVTSVLTEVEKKVVKLGGPPPVV